PARVVTGAALPNNDAARPHRLAAVNLDAQPLAGRIASVTNRTLPFLVCHPGILFACSRCRLVEVRLSSLTYLSGPGLSIGLSAFFRPGRPGTFMLEPR